MIKAVDVLRHFNNTLLLSTVTNISLSPLNIVSLILLVARVIPFNL